MAYSEVSVQRSELYWAEKITGVNSKAPGPNSNGELNFFGSYDVFSHIPLIPKRRRLSLVSNIPRPI